MGITQYLLCAGYIKKYYKKLQVLTPFLTVS